MSVREGPQSWAYIYMARVWLTIGTALITLLPIVWWKTMMGYILFWVPSAWMFLDCRWFQNKLSAFRNSYEQKFR
jgi:hypothetical protein